jgi:hypothetical protein
MSVPLLIGRMVNGDDGKFADRIFVVPVESSDMKGFSLSRSLSPDTSNSACSFDELGNKVDSGKLLWMDSRSFTDSVDLFVVSFVGIPFGDHDVEVEDSSAEAIDALPEFMGYEFGHFGFIDEDLFELVEVVVVEDFDDIFELGLEELAVGLAHLFGSAFEIGDVEVVFFRVIERSDEELLSIGDFGEKLWFLVNERQIVEFDVD